MGKQGLSFDKVLGFPPNAIAGTGRTPRNKNRILDITTWILMPGNKEVHDPSFLCICKMMSFCELPGTDGYMESAGCVQLLK